MVFLLIVEKLTRQIPLLFPLPFMCPEIDESSNEEKHYRINTAAQIKQRTTTIKTLISKPIDQEWSSGKQAY